MRDQTHTMGPMGETVDVELPKAVRWSLWVLVGVLSGVVVGFAFGLTKPRVPSSDPSHL